MKDCRLYYSITLNVCAYLPWSTATSSGRSTSSMRSSSSRSHEPVLSKLFRMSCAWETTNESETVCEPMRVRQCVKQRRKTALRLPIKVLEIHSHCLCKYDHIKEREYMDTATRSNMNTKKKISLHMNSIYKNVNLSGHLIIWKRKSTPRWKSIWLNKTSICPQTENERGHFKLCGRRTRGSYQLLGRFLMHFKAILNIKPATESSKENKLFEERCSPHFCAQKYW